MNQVADPPSTGQDRSRTVQVALGVGLVAIVLVVVAIGFWQLLEFNATWQLGEARKHLQAGLSEPQEFQLSHADAAEKALKSISEGDPAVSSTRDLLLAAAMSMQQRALGADFPLRLSEEIEQLSLAARPQQCSYHDIHLAARVFQATGRPKQADWLAGHAMERKLEPHDRAETLALAAQVAYELGNEGAALHHAHQLIELFPERPEGWRVIAAVHEESGQTELLVDAYRKLLAIDSEEEASIRRKLAERLLELGQTPKAKEQIDWLRKEAPAEVESHPILLAELYQLEGNSQEAGKIADAILASDAGHEKATLLKARILIAGDKQQEAATLLQNYVRKDPFSNQAHYLLGQALARLGESKEAQHHLDVHRRLLDAGVRLYQLRRDASRDPHSVQLQREMARLNGELGLDQP